LFFVCAEAGSKIYITSGHDTLKNALKIAKVSDG
jgi:hypothetical protein